MPTRMNLHRVAFFVITIIVGTSALFGRDSEPVWYWFASCGSSEMTIEAQLDGVTISRTIFFASSAEFVGNGGCNIGVNN